MKLNNTMYFLFGTGYRMKDVTFIRVAVIALFSALMPAISHAQISNISCNVNSTISNASDDFITFSLKPTAPTSVYEAPYTYTVTATQGGSPVSVTLSDGTAATAVGYFYDYAMPFRLQNGTAGNGAVQITVTPNWGSYAPAVFTLNDPGSCAVTACTGLSGKTLTYTYESPRDVLDFTNMPTLIPKFDNSGGRILTGVSVVLSVKSWGSFVLENYSMQDQNYRAYTNVEHSFYLNSANMHNLYDDTVLRTPSYPALASVSSRQYVPVAGSWPGDIITPANPPVIADTSTLSAMPWLSHALILGMPVVSDPKWVSNVTGNSVTDDDIRITTGVNKNNSATFNYTSSSPEFALFSGTGGNVPLTYSNLSTIFLGGGGGANTWLSRVTGSFTVTVSYTYTDCAAGPLLPIKLVSFTAKAQQCNAQLNWQTSMEQNFSRFEIESSSDGAAFKKVGTVNGKNNPLGSSYNFSYPQLADKVYYRLKMVDKDGAIQYSSTVTVSATCNVQSALEVYPNPARGQVKVQLHGNSSSNTYQLVDALGQVLRKGSLQANSVNSVNINGVASGVYILKVWMDGVLQTKQVRIIQ